LVSVAVHALERGQRPVIPTLGLGAEAQVDAEARFLFLGEGLGEAGFAARVMGADIFPKFAVNSADAAEFPGGICEFFDENFFVEVGGLVCFVQAAQQLREMVGVLAGEQVRARGVGYGFVR
jgi:hypothetical protein